MPLLKSIHFQATWSACITFIPSGLVCMMASPRYRASPVTSVIATIYLTCLMDCWRAPRLLIFSSFIVDFGRTRVKGLHNFKNRPSKLPQPPCSFWPANSELHFVACRLLGGNTNTSSGEVSLCVKAWARACIWESCRPLNSSISSSWRHAEESMHGPHTSEMLKCLCRSGQAV